MTGALVENKSGEVPAVASGHIFSASEEDAYTDFFLSEGFVVVEGLLDETEVAKSLDELWSSQSLLGGYPDLQRNDPNTWDSDSWPAGSRNFLESLDPMAEQQSWTNRTNPAIARVFEMLLGRASREEGSASVETTLCASVDRFGVMRPTFVRSREQTGNSGGAPSIEERPEWRTTRNWLHWDQNPWSTPDFHGVQGLVSLTKSTATSGGFMTVPAFHREFMAWAAAHPEGSLKDKQSRQTLPFMVPQTDEMQKRRTRVPMSSGSLLVWDSRMPHQSYPNEDTTWRVCQYVTYAQLPKLAAEARSRAWHLGLRTGLLQMDTLRHLGEQAVTRLGLLPSSPATSQEQSTSEPNSRKDSAFETDSPTQAQKEAAKWLRRARRLQMNSCEPADLMEAVALRKKALQAHSELAAAMRAVNEAERLAPALPFWIL